MWDVLKKLGKYESDLRRKSFVPLSVHYNNFLLHVAVIDVEQKHPKQSRFIPVFFLIAATEIHYF